MRTFLLSLCLTFFCSLSLPAQDTTWIDSEWNQSSRAQAMYFHLEYVKGGLTHFTDYFASNNQVQNTGQYKEGKEQGNFVWFYENGNKASQVSYVNGKRDGIFTKWYSNGVVAEEGQYKDGRFVPPWKYYDEEGELKPLNDLVDIADFDNMPAPVLVEGEEDPDPNAFIIAEKEPYLLNMDEVIAAIGYPVIAIEAEIEGKVIVRVLVGKTGLYERHIVIRKAHPILYKAVNAQISKLKFEPGIMAGKAVKLWVTIPFDFKLIKPKKDDE